MQNGLKLCTLLLAALLISGCGQKINSAGFSETPAAHASRQQEALPENNPADSNKLVQKAKSAIGTPYVSGGSAPGGFDCSGLVKWAYNSVGVELPRTAREQAAVGKKVNHVKDMRAGDIVAFRHPKRGYHTGIYVGDGKFVHSPRKSTHVRINSLSDPYFKSTLLGARRVSLEGSENLIALTDDSLAARVAEKSKLKLSSRNQEKGKNTPKRQSRKEKTVAKAETGNSGAIERKKSTIASQASKIQSVKSVTGASKAGSMTAGAHDRLASASRQASGHRDISMLQLAAPAKARSRS